MNVTISPVMLILFNRHMLKNLFIKTTDSLREYVESRFVVHKDNKRGWYVKYQADQSLENDWFNLNKEGSFQNWHSPEIEIGYYSNEEKAQKARTNFVIRKCLNWYE